MSSLKHVDRLRLERFLEMGGGYVCNFSDRTFGDFVMETTGVNVYAAEYEDGGTSKANRLRTFWKKEDDLVTVKLLQEIVEYQKIQKQTPGKDFSAADAALYNECSAIAERIKGENTISPPEVVGTEVKNGIVEILNDQKYPQGKRSFSLFKKRFSGFGDDELREILRDLGAQSFRNAQNEELWGLRTRNEKENSTTQSNQQVTTSRQIVGEYVLRDEIVKILLSKGYPEGSLHSAWKQGEEEYDLVIIDPATKEILVVFLFELYEPNPAVISSKSIREVIRKFASLVIGPKTQLYYITGMNGEFSFTITKILSQTKNSDLPIFIKTEELPEFKMFKCTNSNAAPGKETELKHKSISVNKLINEFTDEELLTVIRRAENTNVPGSQYQKAYNEWQIRHQQKMLEASQKQPLSTPPPIHVSGDYVGGDKVDKRSTPREKIDWGKWGALASIIAVPIAIYGLLYTGGGFQQEVHNSPNSINTIGQIGNNTITGKSARYLSEEQKVILKNILSGMSGRAALKSKIFDPEAKTYAEQLSESFTSAGWNVTTPLGQDLLDDFDGKVNVFKTGKNATSSLNIFLVEKIPAFDQAGISYESKIPRVGSFGGNLQEDTLYIEVGSN